VSQKTIKKRREFTQAFKERAVARMDKCASVVGLAEELGICWSLLYKWRAQLKQATVQSREETLMAQVSDLQRALGVKALEVDFLKGALQKDEARRRNGGVASTTRSGK
jgi:transposase-like protein